MRRGGGSLPGGRAERPAPLSLSGRALALRLEGENDEEGPSGVGQ
jgi:hypothetical protein